MSRRVPAPIASMIQNQVGAGSRLVSAAADAFSTAFLSAVFADGSCVPLAFCSVVSGVTPSSFGVSDGGSLSPDSPVSGGVVRPVEDSLEV